MKRRRELAKSNGWAQEAALTIPAAQPAASTIYRDYLKEVCHACLRYDRGVHWKHRLPDLGLVFCTPACQAAWTAATPPDVQDARRALQKLLLRRNPAADAAAPDRPVSPAEVADRWAHVERDAQAVHRALRFPAAAPPSKQDMKALLRAQAAPLDPGTLWYLFAGVVAAAHDPDAWAAVTELAVDAAPYRTRADLEQHAHALLALVAALQGGLAAHATVGVARVLQSRSGHNVFGIRSLGEGVAEEPGSEVLGYGLWPAASYWNHSCAPNVRKRREGREWVFWAARDVECGEELCISYLGGDEGGMEAGARIGQLREWWGFDCECGRCARAVEEWKKGWEPAGEGADVEDGRGICT